MEITRPTVMEVSKENFKYNVEQIKQYVGDQVNIMPVIKANGYGTHINKQLELIELFNIVALATADEAIEIKNIGFKNDTLVLNQPAIEEIDKIANHNIIVGICSDEFAQELKNRNLQIRVHLEIETGMNRTGIKVKELDGFIDKYKDVLIIEGVYTHLSSADYDEEYTTQQLEEFNKALSIIKEKGIEPRYIHAAASNGILNYPEVHFNLVRPGIILYGYAASDSTFDKIDLKPVATLKSKIIYLKEVDEDESIGYGRSFKTKSKMKIATVPIGYADGFRRTFSNGWEVLVNGQRVKIAGKVCMDSFMIDVTDVPDVKEGDEVIIWDNKEIKLEDLSNKCETINYEILSQIGERVPRKFV